MSKLTKGQGPKPVVGVEPAEKTNRPDMEPRRKGEVLFHDAGPTGWGRIRRLGDYKGNRSEEDFRHLHDQFTEEETE